MTEAWEAKPFWFDDDGEYYTCGWYEAANFCKYSKYYTMFFLTERILF